MDQFGEIVFAYARNFYLQQVEKLQDKFSASDSQCLLGGSLSRMEALPMSDLDVVFLGESDETLDQKDWNEFDRIDCVKVKDNKQGARMMQCMTPEAGFLDSIPITRFENIFYDMFNEDIFLINKLAFEYNFSRLFNDRSENSDHNLKYSPGGYRDILLINWCSRILGDSNYQKDTSEIVHSIRVLYEILGFKIDQDKLLDAIAYIMIVKSWILITHSHSETRGFTSLNRITVQNAIRYKNNPFAKIMTLSVNETLVRYSLSKKLVGQFLDSLVEFVLKSQRDKFFTETYVLLNIIQHREVQNEAVSKHLNSDFYPLIATMILTKNLDASHLHYLAQRFTNDPGHYYTNRLILKNEDTSQETIEMMLCESRFALDEFTNRRYLDLARKKLAL
ncbi:hypothetical protein QQ008_13495 [Fulvivirgaceae bacterium BMA10]|uniref:Polymerase nucleotidyl transferase domain-containing protein n=1 Tax=Splendidivirga corallicola TaxID=3051826 RepID=A0ABT8KSE4_9BACT|nr:hypothetical protein [Fulvivirgaceae bacterium BMA10]